MRRKIHAAIILAVACIFLTAGIFILNNSSKPKNTDTYDESTESVEVTNYPVSTISAIAITNDKTSIGFLLRGETVELVLADSSGSIIDNGSSTEYSQSELRSLAYTVCHLTGTKSFGEVDDAEKYGYSNPNANVTIILSDSTYGNYMLLNKAPNGKGYYFLNDDTKELYLIDESTAGLFLRNESDFISHSIFPTISGEDYTRVKEINFKNSSGEFKITNEGNTFYLKEPIEQKLRAYNVYSMLIVPMTTLYADSCVATGTDINSYGFDEPDINISIRIDDEVYSALFKQDGDNLLMANPNTGDIYNVSGDIIKLLPDTYMDILDGNPYYYSFGDCLSVRTITDDFDIIFEIEGSGENIQAKTGTKNLDTDETVQLSEKVNGIEISRSADGLEKGDCILTIEFTTKTGSIETVKFYECNKDYITEVNGTSNFLSTGVSVSNLLSLLIQYN